jgi:hypothetical protein
MKPGTPTCSFRPAGASREVPGIMPTQSSISVRGKTGMQRKRRGRHEEIGRNPRRGIIRRFPENAHASNDQRPLVIVGSMGIVINVDGFSRKSIFWTPRPARFSTSLLLAAARNLPRAIATTSRRGSAAFAVQTFALGKISSGLRQWKHRQGSHRVEKLAPCRSVPHGHLSSQTGLPRTPRFAARHYPGGQRNGRPPSKCKCR